MSNENNDEVDIISYGEVYTNEGFFNLVDALEVSYVLAEVTMEQRFDYDRKAEFARLSFFHKYDNNKPTVEFYIEKSIFEEVYPIYEAMRDL